MKGILVKLSSGHRIKLVDDIEIRPSMLYSEGYDLVGNEKVVLATYPTRQRAQEVLDDIFYVAAITSSAVIVYTMPND